ncbi:MAG: cytochrome c biogenesis protein [Candidatus Moranbacteria bacterium]|nr:cytochrome c biogenesis protein [Candidatus Moranbacteria bacterium]
MKKFLFLFLLLLVFFLPSNVFAQEKKTAILFYADWCSHCQKVEAYFKQQGFFEKYDIQKKNFDDNQNKILLGKIFAVQKKTEGVGIPALIIDEQLITGDQPIINQFEKTIESSKGKTFQYVEGFESSNKKNSSQGGVTISFLFLGAFADAANPCALAVLILLLATVISAKGKNRALLSGFMFSLAIFLSYSLIGFGLYKAITILNIGKYLSLSVGILAILIALANFKDVFWYGKFFIMEVPLSWRPKMQEIIRKATGPWSAFGIGFLVSLFLVPCTGGPYAIILGRLAEKTDPAKTVSLLILYNFVFVSPMILITLAMYFFNVKMKKLEAIRKNNLRLLHAVTGIIMLLLGIYLFHTRV